MICNLQNKNFPILLNGLLINLNAYIFAATSSKLSFLLRKKYARSNPGNICVYVPVSSQEPVIRWLSSIAVLHICISIIYCTLIMLLVLSFELFYIGQFWVF